MSGRPGTTEAVRVRTGDGCHLFGLVESVPQSDIAVVYVHGLGANFYLSFTDTLARILPDAGLGFVRGNLRDADILRIDETFEPPAARKGGSGYHRFADSIHDLRA